MAKKSSIAKQKKREKLVALKQDKRAELKSVIYDMNRSEDDRHEAVMALNKMSPNTSKVRLRNRCVLTGRCRGVYRKFKLSRLKFRELASNGLIPGVTKASW